MEEVEIWKSLDFLGYPDYEVSSFGRVKSLKRGKEKILKFEQTKANYYRVQLNAKSVRKHIFVHRLVAFAFIPNDNPTEKNIINHKDQNPSNNHVSNLEWCTQQYNSIYNDAHIKRGEKRRGIKFSEEHKKKISDSKKGENHPMYGKQFTEERKENISKALKGKYVGENHWCYGKKRDNEFISKISKPILQLDLQGNFIKEFDSAKSASLELGIDSSCIGKCCKGKRKTCGGFIWKYKENNTDLVVS